MPHKLAENPPLLWFLKIKDGVNQSFEFAAKIETLSLSAASRAVPQVSLEHFARWWWWPPLGPWWWWWWRPSNSWLLNSCHLYKKMRKRGNLVWHFEQPVELGSLSYWALSDNDIWISSHMRLQSYPKIKYHILSILEVNCLRKIHIFRWVVELVTKAVLSGMLVGSNENQLELELSFKTIRKCSQYPINHFWSF